MLAQFDQRAAKFRGVRMAAPITVVMAIAMRMSGPIGVNVTVAVIMIVAITAPEHQRDNHSEKRKRFSFHVPNNEELQLR